MEKWRRKEGRIIGSRENRRGLGEGKSRGRRQGGKIGVRGRHIGGGWMEATTWTGRTRRRKDKGGRKGRWGQ